TARPRAKRKIIVRLPSKDGSGSSAREEARTHAIWDIYTTLGGPQLFSRSDEGENSVVASLVVGLIAGDEDGEVFLGGEPGDGEPHGVAAGVGQRGAGGPGLVVGDDPAHGVFRLAGGGRVKLLEGF